MDIRRAALLLAFPAGLLSIPLPAVEPPDIGVQVEPAGTLPPLVVTAPRLARALEEVPAATTVVEEDALQRARQGLQLDEAINRVPGVFTQNRYNFAQNLRISMRGFGARAPFGVRGIRVLLDGIPETLPDGQSQLDMIDLESAERVEIIRGPASVLYGNASGGVVDVQTREGPVSPSGQIRGTVGSDGFQRLGVQGGGSHGDLSYHLSAWDMRYDGYRDHSETEKRLLHGKARFAVDHRRSLTAVVSVLDQPMGKDPGALTRGELRDDRRAAAPMAQALDAGQEVEQQRLGLIYTDTGLAGGELRLRTHLTRRDFEQQLPFPGPSRIAFDRAFYGAGAEYSGGTRLAGRPVRFLVGVELDRQEDDRQRYTVDAAGTTTGRVQDEMQTALAGGVFAQADVDLTRLLDLTLGVRYDHVRFRIHDRLRADGDDSGTRRFDEVSYLAGLGWQLHPDHRLYLNVATAFETPTFTEFAVQGGGGFNPDIEPQQAVNLELGAKGFLGDSLRYEAAAFVVRTQDEIVNIETDGNAFANAGRTRRYGLELGLDYFLTPDWSLGAAYTWSDFRFRRFEDPATGQELRGQRLPGIPEHALFTELAYLPPMGYYAVVDVLVAGNLYADNANEVRVGGFGVINARAGRRWLPARQGELEVFIALNNLLDRDYIANTRINANPAQPAENRRYFEPAPGRNAFGGIRYTF